MKKLILLTSVFLYCLSCSGQDSNYKDGRFTLDTLVYYNFRIKPDTIPAKLLVSNTYKKQSSGVWVINGFIVTNFLGTTAYLGRKRKLIPKYIHVWNYITTK